MQDPRIKKLANLLTTYCVAVEKGERVAIRTTLPAMPLARETYRAVLQAGGLPHIVLRDLGLAEIYLREADNDQLQYVDPFNQLAIEQFDCLIGISGSDNTRTLSSIDPAKQQIAAKANNEIAATMMRRAAAGELRWVGTLFPTAAHAQEADMSLEAFEDFVYAACRLDSADPVADWTAVHARHAVLCDYLAGKENVRVIGPNADLTLSIKGRTFINGDGRHNMPCGEIFTGPVEQSVNGWIRYTYPAIVQGREVEGIELTFDTGKVVKATAAKNEAFLHQVLDTDPGARYLGEFAIGTNNHIQQFTKSILFDEKIGGTIHLAVGRSYPESGGLNQSAVHWDMICDMRDGGQIFIDDELFYDSGNFTI
jgi:aminopeptidase